MHGSDGCTYTCPTTGDEVLAFRDARHIVVDADEYRRQRERVEALERALRPLVKQLGDWYSRVGDDLDVYTAPSGEHWGLDTAIQEGRWLPAYTIGDLRRARAVLNGHTHGEVPVHQCPECNSHG